MKNMKNIIISLLLVLSLTAFAGCTSGGNVGDEADDASDTVGLMPRHDDDVTDRADTDAPMNGDTRDDRGGTNDSGIIGDNGGLNNNDSRDSGNMNGGNDAGNGDRSANGGNSVSGNGGTVSPDGIM